MLRTGRFRPLAVVEGTNSTKGVHRGDSYLGRGWCETTWRYR